jgi:hypothetical protein
MKPVVTVIIVVVVGALAFYGGTQYQLNKQSSGRNSLASGQYGVGTGRTGTRRTGNGQPVSGKILNIDTSSITVELTDGSSRIVLLSDKTIFNTTTAVDKSQLKVGDKVGVFGTTNTDGSVTAQNVQLNPQFRMGGTAGGSASGSAK